MQNVWKLFRARSRLRGDRQCSSKPVCGQLPGCRLSTRKGGVLLHLNHIATASTRWRARNLFEMNRLAAEIHQNRRLRTAPESPRPYPQHDGMEQKNES